MKRIACIHWTGADGKSPIERANWGLSNFVPTKMGLSPCRPNCRSSSVAGSSVRSSVSIRPTAAASSSTSPAWPICSAAKRRWPRRSSAILPSSVIRSALAVADTVGAAWAAVHYGAISNQQSTINNQQSFAFLHPLPIEALRLPAETVRLLHELGLVRIGQLEALPREEFLSRFGAGAVAADGPGIWTIGRARAGVPATAEVRGRLVGRASDRAARNHRCGGRVADRPGGGDVGPLRPRRPAARLPAAPRNPTISNQQSTIFRCRSVCFSRRPMQNVCSIWFNSSWNGCGSVRR